MKLKKFFDEPHQAVRKSKRIPYAKQTEKLGGIPYYTINNKKKISKNCISQENQINQPDQPQTKNEEPGNRIIRTITEKSQTDSIIRRYKPKQSYVVGFNRRRGNVECQCQTATFHDLRYFRQLFKFYLLTNFHLQTLIDFCHIYVFMI